MRTTVRLDDQLLQQAKLVAAQSGRTLTAVIEDALREALARRSARGEQRRIVLPTEPGWGLRPGVDLDDSAALLDLMEGEDAPS